MTKLAAALIVRDCAPTLRACLESIRPHVDFLCIVDTGSTDETPTIAQEFATHFEVYTGCNVNPLTGQTEQCIWDFADARNRAFALVPEDAEWVWWQDADDVVIGAETLRAAAESAPPGPYAFLAPYEYSYDSAGNPTCIHWRERLIRNPRSMVWTTPCHEVCVPRSGGISHAPLNGVLIKHRAQEAASMPGAKPREPQRNLRILTAYLKRVGEGDVRAMYYCGVEYARHGMFGKAREMLRRYVQLSGWSDERCLAELELGRIYFQEGDCDEALRWASAALLTKSWPDPYWLLSRTFFRMAVEGANATEEYNLRRCVAWHQRGRPLEDAQTVLFYNPTDRYDTERFVARASASLGDMDAAAEACRRGLSRLQGDPELMELLRNVETIRIGGEMDTLLGRLEHLGRIGPREVEAVKAIVTGQVTVGGPSGEAPSAAVNPFARIGTGQPANETDLEPVAEGKLDIVIFTGPAMENWTPKTIEETGIGGSETMAWEMARGLARLGHRVRHYGMCTAEQEGVYEGVLWLDMARYSQVSCDVLVVSRYPGVTPESVKAKASLLWVHDVHCGAMFQPQHAAHYDRVLCLSNWHKEFFCATYPFMDPERVVVTRNGIDLSPFDGTDERNPHRAVYSSSPDRGLQTALELWPLVRAEVPDAELHVFYGFAGLRAGRPADAALADRLEAQAKATPGVVLHGRVSPRELAREFLKSGVLMYPTWFAETSMIGAMQAQAAGLRIVTSPIAALNETVGDRGVLIPGAPGPVNIAESFDCAPCSPEFRRAFVAAAVGAMAYDPKCPDETRGWQMRQAADRFDIRTLCADWSTMLTSLVASLATDPIPRFYVAPEFVAAGERDETEAA